MFNIVCDIIITQDAIFKLSTWCLNYSFILFWSKLANLLNMEYKPAYFP